MPLFRSKHLQLLSTCFLTLTFVFVGIRDLTLLSSNDPPNPSNHVIQLAGSIKHASFIKLQPFGFTDDSFFSMNITVNVKNLPPSNANALQLTTRTLFHVLLCNEDEWSTIKSIVPSYCNTTSYMKKDLCTWFPLNNATRVTDNGAAKNNDYASTTYITHENKDRFFGRLVINSCALKERLDEEVAMDLTTGLTMANIVDGEKVYIGFENEHQQLLALLLIGTSTCIVVVWALVLIKYRKSTTSKIQLRFCNILLSLIFLNAHRMFYWRKRTRGDVWKSYKDEMVQLENAVEMLSLAIMLECLLLIAVGWGITQQKLSSYSWKLVYGTEFLYFASVFINVVAASASSNGPVSSIVGVVSYLFYFLATFTTYYLISYATTANIDALWTQLDLIRYIMRVEPKTTPSWKKLVLFQNFRIWVLVFVTVTTLFEVISLIVQSNDDNEKYGVVIVVVGYLVDIVTVLTLLWVFRPVSNINVFFRPIPTVNIDTSNVTINEGRVVPSIDAIDVTPTPSQRLQRLPTVTGVVLAPYVEAQALPPVVVGRLIDRTRSLTGRQVVVHPVHV
jgi:hypothetical protein